MEKIAFLRRSQLNYLENQKFLQADMTAKHIKELEFSFANSRMKKLQAKHAQDWKIVQKTSLQQQTACKKRWQSTLQAFDLKANNEQEQFILQQQKKIEVVKSRLENSLPNKFRKSSQVLQLEAAKAKAIQTQQFIEAHQLQQKINRLLPKEKKVYENKRKALLNSRLTNVLQKAAKDFQIFQQKQKQSRDQLLRRRDSHYELQQKRIDNVKQELEISQNVRTSRVQIRLMKKNPRAFWSRSRRKSTS